MQQTKRDLTFMIILSAFMTNGIITVFVLLAVVAAFAAGAPASAGCPVRKEPAAASC